MWPYNSTPHETSEPDGNHKATASSNINFKPAPPAKQIIKTYETEQRTFNPLTSSQVKLPLMTPQLNTQTQLNTLPENSMLFFTAYGPKLKVTIDFPPGFGRTKQSFKADADVNNIMQKYIKTGTLEFTQKHEARYGDATGIDFQHCMDVIRNAQNMFNDMPAQLRKRFHNDPAEFLDFIQEPGNQDEAVRLGLATSKQGGATPPPHLRR